MELVFISFCVKLDQSLVLFQDSHASYTAIPAACHPQLSLRELSCISVGSVALDLTSVKETPSDLSVDGL